MNVIVTRGLKRKCGITRFADRLAAAIEEEGHDVDAVKPKDAVEAAASDSDLLIVNFEHGVMSMAALRKALSRADHAVVILHTIDDKVRNALDWISARAKTVALHPSAFDLVDHVILHPTDIRFDSVVAPSEVEALASYGLIRQGKGIELVISLARSLGLDKVLVRGEVQREEVLEALEEFADTLGVEFVVKGEWRPEDVRKDVKEGVLPVIPSVATTHQVIWASGTEADLIGSRVPYVPYNPLGGHNPCAYAIKYGGPSYVTMFTEGVDATAKRAAEFVNRVSPETFNRLARTVLQGARR
jgi:hypothetical protein